MSDELWFVVVMDKSFVGYGTVSITDDKLKFVGHLWSVSARMLQLKIPIIDIDFLHCEHNSHGVGASI